MKYPKLFDGPHAIGEANNRAFDRSTPYLTIQGLDSTARKRGAFREVSVLKKKLADPYFYTRYISVEALLEPLRIDLQNKYVAPEKPETAPYGHGPQWYVTQLTPFVGDGYVMTMWMDDGGVPTPYDYQVRVWPQLVWIAQSSPRLPAGDPDGAKKTVDFWPIATENLESWFTNAHVFPVGYKNDAERYVVGFSYLYPDNRTGSHPTFYYDRQPRMYIGNTGTRTMHEVTLPTYADRENAIGAPALVGAGMLQLVNTVPEDTEDFFPYPYKAHIPPYFSCSADFGETWSSVVATCLDPYLCYYTDAGHTYELYYYPHQYYLAACSIIQYIGNGQVMFYMPAGALTHPLSSPQTAPFRPMLFIGDAHVGSLTKVTWPADDVEFEVDWTGHHSFLSRANGTLRYTIGWRRMAGLRNSQWVFGPGCIFVPVAEFIFNNADIANQPQETGWRIMFTHNAGATWDWNAAPIPTAVQNVRKGGIAGCVIKPYVDDSAPGELEFCGFDEADQAFEIWKTDGNFSYWTRVHRKLGVVNFDSIQMWDPVTDSSFYGVNYGNQTRGRYIMPAFPGEFEA